MARVDLYSCGDLGVGICRDWKFGSALADREFGQAIDIASCDPDQGCAKRLVLRLRLGEFVGLDGAAFSESDARKK